MEWVKLLTKYPRDTAILTGDDADEVMFTRGMAHVGENETGGFIPDAALAGLTRWHTRRRKIADKLVERGLWEKAPGGYRIVNWHKHNAELEAIIARRRVDAIRQKRKRAKERASREASRDRPRDSHAPREEEVDAAAAACELPPILDVFRGKLRRFTALSALRWDTLTADQAAELQRLVDLHGDDRLVDVAVRTCRTPPPVHVSAFLGTWQSLPTAAERLRIVDEPKCPKHPHELARSCRGCAADDLAGDQP